MIRVDIETIFMAAGPVPSAIVLRERGETDGPQLRTLSIQTGSFEAAALSKSIEGSRNGRPITHELFSRALDELGCKVERVEIARVEAPVFYADLVIVDASGAEHHLDARPSDALSLAVRSNAPIYVEDDVMNRAGTVRQPEEPADDEFERFDAFVSTLTPNDF